MELSERVLELGTEEALAVAARAAELEAAGRDLVRLDLGEPDTPTSPAVVEEACRALREGFTRYAPPLGWRPLREAIAQEVSSTRGVAVSPEEVVVHPGVKPGMFYAAAALLRGGDEAIVPDPGFPIYPSAARFAGAKVVPLPLREENGFAPDPAELRSLLTPRTRILFLNSPHNPTGAVVSREVLEEIVALVRERPRVVVVSDEIYSRILFDGFLAPSPLAVDGMRDRVVVLDGFSKTYAMTGWRLGFSVWPRAAVPAIERLVVNTVTCTPPFVQRAGLAALRSEPGEIAARVAEFRRRRDAFVAALRAVPGAKTMRTQGGFLLFASLGGGDDRALARSLLEEAGVACVPGSSFGARGEGWLRFSLVAPIPRLEEAAARIGEWVRGARSGRGA